MGQKSIKLLRNESLYSTYDEAISILKTKLSSLDDGEILICSYGTSWESAKSVIGVARYISGKHSYSIYNTENVSKQDILDEIAKLDSSVSGTSTDGHISVDITESDGKLTAVSVVTDDIASANDLSDEIGRATTAEGEISDKLDEVESNAMKCKVVSLTTEEINKLPDGANVKSAYKVMSYTGDWETATDKQQVGETIKIYKESSLESVSFETEKPGEKEGETIHGYFLKFVYVLSDGNKETVYVDLSELIHEVEVKDGIAVDATDHKIYIKLDTNCESFLTVSADGLKLSGVQDAIDVEAGRATAAEQANATAITAEETRAMAAEQANATAIETLQTEVINNEEVTAESIIKIANASGIIDEDGAIGYQQKTNANYISDAVSLDDATVKLDTKLKELKDGFVETDSDARLKSLAINDGTHNLNIYTMSEGGVPTTYFEAQNNGRLYLSGSDDSLGQIILDANNIHPWSTGGFGNMGTAGNPWAYTYSNNVYTDRIASKNGTLWFQGLINNGNPSNASTIDNVYFKANNICPGSIDSNNNLGTSVYPWKALNAIEATIGRANGAYGKNVITKGILKLQNTNNSYTSISSSTLEDTDIDLAHFNDVFVKEATLDGYYPLAMVESSSSLPKYESLFTKTNIKYNPVQNILEAGRIHAHTYTYSEHPENASLVVYNSLDSGSQSSLYTSMRPRVGFVYYDNHVDDRYCGQIVMDKDGYTFYRGTSDNSKNPDGSWKGTNDSVYKASNGGTPYAALRCGEISTFTNNSWKNVMTNDLSNITVSGETKIKDVINLNYLESTLKHVRVSENGISIQYDEMNNINAMFNTNSNGISMIVLDDNRERQEERTSFSVTKDNISANTYNGTKFLYNGQEIAVKNDLYRISKMDKNGISYVDVNEFGASIEHDKFVGTGMEASSLIKGNITVSEYGIDVRTDTNDDNCKFKYNGVEVATKDDLYNFVVNTEAGLQSSISNNGYTVDLLLSVMSEGHRRNISELTISEYGVMVTTDDKNEESKFTYNNIEVATVDAIDALNEELEKYKELLLLVNSKCVYTDFGNKKHASSGNMAAVISSIKNTAKIIHLTGNMDGITDAAHWFEGTDTQPTLCERLEELDASQIEYFFATFNKSKVLLPDHLNCYNNKTFVGCFGDYKGNKLPKIIECANLQPVVAENYPPMYNSGYSGSIEPWRHCFSKENVFTNLPTFNGLRYSPTNTGGRFNLVSTITPTEEEWENFCKGLGTPLQYYNNFLFHADVWNRIKALPNFSVNKAIAVQKGWTFND